MINNRTIQSLILIQLLFSCNLFDNKEKLAKEHLVQLISNQSEGAISLIKFTKTNGLEKNEMGEIFYVLEWEATIEVHQDIWKGGDAIGGYWNNFNVMKKKPDFWGAFLQGEPKLFIKGTTLVLNGLSKFEKTENGWRIVEIHIKNYRVSCIITSGTNSSVNEIKEQTDKLSLLREKYKDRLKVNGMGEAQYKNSFKNNISKEEIDAAWNAQLDSMIAAEGLK